MIVPGAGPAALGEAQVAKADDAYASYFNPAGLGFLYEQDPSKDNFNFDLGNDNYLIDPSKDKDDPIINPKGTESNGNYDFGEFFYDFGVDGKSNIFENGYDEKNNPDPNNDDFHPVNNPTGTELNNKYDVGELFNDFGIDGIEDGIGEEWGEPLIKFNPYGTENNNLYDLGEKFYDFGVDGIPNEKEPGYNPDPAGDNYSIDNPTGTENNGKFDNGETFTDQKIKYSKFKLSFSDSLFSFYKIT